MRGGKRPRMRVPKTVEQFEREIKKPHLLRLDLGLYWWIRGEHRGRRVILGPFLDEKSAYEAGYEQLSSDFTVLMLRTKDEAKASRLIRAMVLEETRNLDNTFKRFRHSVDGNEESKSEK